MSSLLNEKNNDAFICEFCGKRYVREKTFLAHMCEQKRRFEHSKTPRGQIAYHLYVKWLSKNFHARRVSLEAFLSSSTYLAFVRFVDWGLEVELPGFDRYIDFVTMKKYTPVMWMYPEVYSQFIEFLDVKMTVEDHIEITIQTLSKLSANRGLTINTVLMEMQPGEIIQMIMKRKISPWILIKSKAFKTRWKTFNSDVKSHIERVVNADYWADRMRKNPDGNALVDDVVKRLQL